MSQMIFNEAIKDNIEMQVLGVQILKGDKDEDAYLRLYDCLIDLLIQKRFDESPQL